MTGSLEKAVSVFSSSMSPGLLAALTESISWQWCVALLIGGIAALGAAIGLLLPAVQRRVLPLPHETRLSDYLPFMKLIEEGKTLLCRNGEVVQVMEVQGRDSTFLTKAEREAQFAERKRWLDGLSEMGVTVRVFMMRDALEPEASETDASLHPVLHAIQTAWNASFASSYRNRQIIVISSHATTSKQALKCLHQAVDLTLTVLAEYRPVLLTQSASHASTLLAFWGQIVSPISQPRPKALVQEVNESLTADTVVFGGEDGVIRFRSGTREMLMVTLGIRTFGEYCDEQMVYDISHSEGECVLMHLIEPWGKNRASLSLMQQRRMRYATGMSQAVGGQFDAALEAIEGLDDTAQTLARYSMVVFLRGESEEALTRMEKHIRKIGAHYGATIVREGVAAQASWFSQFPSYKRWPRGYQFFSSHIASLVALHCMPEGHATSSWGEGPIALFRTAGGTVYQFQFHVGLEKDAVAHGVTIGPTGAGKTTLVCFLAAMAMRHPKLRCYLFDRYQGAQVFCQAAGGQYVGFLGDQGKKAGNYAALNPFQCQDTPENRQFLQLWLKYLSGCEDPLSLDQIGFAIHENFAHLGRAARSLRTLYDICFTPYGEVHKNLKKWVDPLLYGDMFNAERDTLDLESTRLMAFDFTHIFKDEELARATISYLMRRIEATITEHQAPALIFIDETEPMLKHPLFKHYFMVMLQEYRKRGAAVISSFQRPEAIAHSGMGELLRGQAQTLYFLPNRAAKESDYADWHLTDREWAFITGKLSLSKRLKRAMLLKRATGESVVLDTDLSPLGAHLKVFSSGRASIQLAEELQAQCGEEWMSHYLEAT